MDSASIHHRPTRRWVLSSAGAGCAGPLLAACGAPGAGGTPPASRKLQGAVEFWTHSGIPYKDHIGATLANEFAAQHPGVTINWTDTAPDVTKLVAAAVAGTPPDIAYTDRYTTASLACRGAASAVDGYVKASRTVKLDGFWPLMRDQVQLNGKVYGMPHQGNAGLLHYNKSVFREVGLNPDQPPATWDEMLQAMPRLIKRSGTGLDRAAWIPTRGWGVPWMVMYWQLGGELLDKDNKKAVFNNEAAAQSFDWLLKVHDLHGGEDAIAALYGGTNANDALSQGKVAMVWANNQIWRTVYSLVNNLEVGVASWPAPASGKRANYMGGFALVIPKGAKNPDAAFAYLEYKLGDEQQIRWANEWESIPSTRSAAQSDKYLSGRLERKVAVADAGLAKFVIGAPGGDTALKYQSGLAGVILPRKLGVRDALNDAVANVQKELDDAARACSA